MNELMDLEYWNSIHGRRKLYSNGRNCVMRDIIFQEHRNYGNYARVFSPDIPVRMLFIVKETNGLI